MWLPPGVSKHIPLVKSLDIAIDMLRHNGLKSVSRGLAVDDSLFSARPSEPHFYLFAIGARSSQQGKGFGGQLMQASLDRVDGKPMPAYLECNKEENVPFYRRFGFEVIDKIIPAAACLPLWLLWRDAR